MKVNIQTLVRTDKEKVAISCEIRSSFDRIELRMDDTVCFMSKY
uniref:Uncharacterized protein n=1 Tax=Candidatus Kentrum sp. TUN TaxID=2126343 RepID=A0A450ZBL7_9GAMM|nr:MAG: hypothetical protein BECKTUN1418E_GA0071001_100525 [Candidatus Kentron sp. TUN]VFK51357.1 MAG: hypothetical protein BECKTUN1418D_GA0071000_100724 [Candidatus Kentron sp. TUN]VFK54483.1 MAG: hypothetical protein BECKTUN1418F_GA0071002_104312 [Candidatus Kentron sp. TUN]